MSLLRWLYGSLIVGILYRYDMITKCFHLNEIITINILCTSSLGLREVSRTFAIRHSPFNGKWQKFDIRCVKLSCHSNSVVHFLKGEGSWWIFLGGQRYFVRNGSNSRWNASYVDGICQAASPDILERSCSSFGRGKVMISFWGGQDHFVRIKSYLIWIVPCDQGISHLLLPGFLNRGCLSIWREKIHN